MKALNAIAGALVIVSAAGFSSPTQAASVYRIAVSHASAACTGSLEVDRDLLHAHTMGVANETDASMSDVKCGGIATPLNNGGDVEVYETALKNSGTESVDVNCSLADGVEDGVTTVSTKYPRTITLDPGSVGWIDWTKGDNNDTNYVYPSLMCQLPTGVSISYTAVLYQEDVGE